MPSAPPTKPAFRSGAGRLCLDFIRTLRHRGRPDADEELATRERLAAWITQFGPFDTSIDVPSGADHTARALREAIYELVAAAHNAAREPPGAGSSPAAARQAVNTAAAEPPPVPQLNPDGRLSYRADQPVAATLALVARDALNLVTSTDLMRLRNCANPDCGVLFVDHSRPGTRRWCSMDTCGNRAKKLTRRSQISPSLSTPR